MEKVNADPFPSLPLSFLFFDLFIFIFIFISLFLLSTLTGPDTLAVRCVPQFPISIPKFVGPTSYRSQEGKPQSPYYSYARLFPGLGENLPTLNRERKRGGKKERKKEEEGKGKEG